MDTLIHFNDFVNEISASNSRLYKQKVLKKYSDDIVIIKYLQIAFDPYKTFGISSKKLNKKLACLDVFSETHTVSVFELFDYLEKHNTGTYQEIVLCQDMLSRAKSLGQEYAELLTKLICKDLSIGVDSKTINKEIPDCIRTFNVQLANKYFEKTSYVEGKKFAITTKIDGCRIIALKENGKVSFYTRAGQLYEGLVDLEDEMTRLMPDNTCLDGEITLLDRGNLSSKEQYKATTKIVRTKDKEKHGVKMLVFDWMPADCFKSQKCDLIYSERRAKLEEIFGRQSFEYFELLPLLYIGEDVSKIIEIHTEQVNNQEEGVMVNIWNAPYKFSRTSDLLKVKTFNDCDLKVIGFEEGIGKYAGMLGAFICEYKEGVVKVGSGLTDDLRKEIWNNHNKYINSIIEITYFEATQDATGKESLRFPVFRDFRSPWDKNTPDF